ncbi:MAG: T9SS type A sorting domain-containing protein [Ferruginibacter sp.]
MKKLLLFLFIAINIQFATGQITTPVVRANFGIEADLSANYFNNAPQSSVDDWYLDGHPGTGQFIIDTTGAAAMVAGYISNPANRTKSFSRLMHQAPYTVVNNNLLLDAVFHRDFHGDDSTIFASGSNKNGMSPVLWSTPIAQSVPDKNEILDAFTHVRRAGPNPTDSLWMFGGLSIENTTGSRYFDFELYQTNIAYDRASLSFNGYGPDAGHTSWVFDAAGNILSPGDIIFTAEFSSSSLTLVEARIWVKKTSLSITPTTFTWGGDFDGDGNGALYGYANILPKSAGTFYTGILNSAAATWAGPYALIRGDNSVVNSYIPRQFMEFSVNLTKLGIEPASFSTNACGTPFRRVLIKSRASTSFTAELKDFIAPFSMFDYSQVDANAFVKYFCDTMPLTTISVYNALPTSVYTWTTFDGNIVGSTTDSVITVDKPGTYYVLQQLHAQCPAFAMDSVTILFDSVCAVLNVNITKFDASCNGKYTSLKWQASNNGQAKNYVIEYSTDNRIFKELATVPANGEAHLSDYTFSYLSDKNEPMEFYRIRVIGKNEANKYSNTILSRSLNVSKKAPLIFPNPVQGKAWLSLHSPTATIVAIYLSDMAGRLVKTIQIPVMQGDNVLALNDLAIQKAGVYIVKVKSIDGETIQKIVVKK